MVVDNNDIYIYIYIYIIVDDVCAVCGGYVDRCCVNVGFYICNT